MAGSCPILYGQAEQHFTRQDSLRGSITGERAWWDLTYYHLQVKILPEEKALEGMVDVSYTVLKQHSVMQIDLQAPLKMSRVTDDKGNHLEVRQEGPAHFVQLKEPQQVGAHHQIRIVYEGKPRIAANPPWDGGFSWDKDQNGTDWIHTNCQGIGASIWWPCKDHLYDEPDSMLISVNVPDKLMNVSNGRLRQLESLNDGTKTWHWFVHNPISNYVINLNIGAYVHFSEQYQGEKGPLDMDYYVMAYNLEKAKRQFKDAPRMMAAFEHWFGPYPFYEDGYKLVEVPTTGMEHQSSVTYGNGFANGYRGRDGSTTGWGMKFDFIIIHESGHEWFANNITYQDMADMWIHESFTNYSESLFLEYHYGKEAGQEYVRGTRRLIQNDKPIIGQYGVNDKGSGDMYVKGGNILNMLRHLIDDDKQWREILRGLNQTFYHQTVTTQQIETYLSAQAGMDLDPFFDQYLRDIRIPVLEYYVQDTRLYYRWNQVVRNLGISIEMTYGDTAHTIIPRKAWQHLTVEKEETLSVHPNYLIATFKIR
ncbi:MAG: M1 family metallopeptidase [Bacteroidota bacterium]